jgi:hypothetical protein
MNSYNLYRETETEKYQVMKMIRAAGARVTNVSGCGSGYYIQLEATPEQAENINKMIDELEGVAV